MYFGRSKKLIGTGLDGAAYAMSYASTEICDQEVKDPEQLAGSAIVAYLEMTKRTHEADLVRENLTNRLIDRMTAQDYFQKNGI